MSAGAVAKVARAHDLVQEAARQRYKKAVLAYEERVALAERVVGVDCLADYRDNATEEQNQCIDILVEQAALKFSSAFSEARMAGCFDDTLKGEHVLENP